MVYDNILEAIGHTPMIRLRRLPDPEGAEILVKYEGLNVGGSIKTRTAYNMILAAEQAGQIGPDTVIVEPTSGNQGIGLALVGAVRGYRTVIIMPDSVSAERRLLVEHYGAEVVLVHDAGNIGDCIAECIRLANEMGEKDPKVWIPQQFSNPNNPLVHKYHTALEIVEQVGGPIHGFCSGVGTGGTLSGVGKALKRHKPQIEVVAVEPDTSAVLSTGQAGKHKIQGIGAGFVPQTYDGGVVDRILTMSYEEAQQGARRLAQREGLLVGISSGAAYAAALRLAQLPEYAGKTIVALLPDTGERYLSTDLFV